MEILDNEHLMFIEPKIKKTEDVIIDEINEFATYLQKNMKSNHDFTKGFYVCSCHKAFSDSVTYSVNISGKKVKTHSLLLHYVQCHRSEIPESEIEKLKQGIIYLKNKGTMI